MSTIKRNQPYYLKVCFWCERSPNTPPCAITKKLGESHHSQCTATFLSNTSDETVKHWQPKIDWEAQKAYTNHHANRSATQS